MPIPAPSRHHISPGTALNKPKDWPAFERLCRDLYAGLLDDVHTDLNGRGGQRQHGVDLYGTDRRSATLVGVQCKKRSATSYKRHAGLTIRELAEAVRKARTFEPPLDELVILTTGPTDAALQQRARMLSLAGDEDRAMRVVVHGWEWIEAQAVRDPDLAIRHHLVALTEQSPGAAADHSPIAREIGGRLARAIELMNAGRREEDRFTLPGLARHLGHSDWRTLERLIAGTVEVSDADLAGIAEGLSISAPWLIEGKGNPFVIDSYCRRLDSIAIHADLVAAKPEQVIFVRQDDPESGCHHVVIAIQFDAVRWTVLDGQWPVWAEIGSGGREDLIALFCLIKRLDDETRMSGLMALGAHLDSETFYKLSAGEIYPGSLYHEFRNDCWPQFLTSLSTQFLKLERPREKSLADTIEMLSFLVSEEGVRRHATGIAARLLRWADGEEVAPG
jgi:hypothetical protein